MSAAGQLPTDDERAWSSYRRGRKMLYAAIVVYDETRSIQRAASLVARSVRWLFAALVAAGSDDEPAPHGDELIERIVELNRDQELFRYRVDQELAWVEQLAESMAAAGDEPEVDGESRARFERFLHRVPEVYADARGWLRRSGRRGATGKARQRRRLLRGAVVVVVVLAVWLARSCHAERYCIPATYFSDVELSVPTVQRCDGRLDFDWGQGAPAGELPVDRFSARWEGRLVVRVAGIYKFHLQSDDGSRLYVDDRLVVDHWGEHAAVEESGKTHLEAGRIPFRLEYFDATEAASVRLLWHRVGERPEVLMGSDVIR